MHFSDGTAYPSTEKNSLARSCRDLNPGPSCQLLHCSTDWATAGTRRVLIRSALPQDQRELHPRPRVAAGQRRPPPHHNRRLQERGRDHPPPRAAHRPEGRNERKWVPRDVIKIQMKRMYLYRNLITCGEATSGPLTAWVVAVVVRGDYFEVMASKVNVNSFSPCWLFIFPPHLPPIFLWWNPSLQNQICLSHWMDTVGISWYFFFFCQCRMSLIKVCSCSRG